MRERPLSHEDSMVQIVMASFEKRPMPSGKLPVREINRRTDMAIQIWETLFNDAKWSQSRILDHMLQFLIRRIDGQGLPAEALRKVRDDESAMWSPETSTKVEGEGRLSALAAKNNSSHKGEK